MVVVMRRWWMWEEMLLDVGETLWVWGGMMRMCGEIVFSVGRNRRNEQNIEANHRSKYPAHQANHRGKLKERIENQIKGNKGKQS